MERLRLIIGTGNAYHKSNSKYNYNNDGDVDGDDDNNNNIIMYTMY